MISECAYSIVDWREVCYKFTTSVVYQESDAEFVFVRVVTLAESVVVATVIDDVVANQSCFLQSYEVELIAWCLFEELMEALRAM